MYAKCLEQCLIHGKNLIYYLLLIWGKTFINWCRRKERAYRAT